MVEKALLPMRLLNPKAEQFFAKNGPQRLNQLANVMPSMGKAAKKCT
jgi:hypothetical protein